MTWSRCPQSTHGLTVNIITKQIQGLHPWAAGNGWRRESTQGEAAAGVYKSRSRGWVFFMPKEGKCFLLGVRNPTAHLLFSSLSNCWNQGQKSSVHCPRGKAHPKEALWFYTACVGKSWENIRDYEKNLLLFPLSKGGINNSLKLGLLLFGC